jgi:3-oxoadipate CoA-transferase beta subunit
MKPFTRAELADRVARALPYGAVVNLGIGMPGLVSGHVRPEQDIILQSENGILNFQGLTEGTEPDYDCIDASKRPIEALPGTAFIDVMMSFGLMRGGHLDVAVLGAFEVSAGGDLANWWTGQPGDVPGVGGAMDLACGAKAIWAMMEHTTKEGTPKIVEACSYPLTAPGVITRIFTDLATIDVTPSGLVVLDTVAWIGPGELQARTGARLHFPERHEATS